MKALIEAAQRFLDIDDKIHSRQDDVSWCEIEADAEEYTEARKALKLAICFQQSIEDTQTTPADGSTPGDEETFKVNSGLGWG